MLRDSTGRRWIPVDRTAWPPTRLDRGECDLGPSGQPPHNPRTQGSSPWGARPSGTGQAELVSQVVGSEAEEVRAGGGFGEAIDQSGQGVAAGRIAGGLPRAGATEGGDGFVEPALLHLVLEAGDGLGIEPGACLAG